MTAEMAQEPLGEEQVLLEGFLDLETPEGFRAELMEGEIVVSPLPSGAHEDALSGIIAQVVRNAAVLMDLSGNKGLLLPRGGRCLKNYVIPDAVFAPRELRVFADAENWMPVDGVAMVVEVTSSRPDRDRVVKRHCYARAGIPLYLLVDRTARSVTLFSEPDQEAEDYLSDARGPFGAPVGLPAPFEMKLETDEFV